MIKVVLIGAGNIAENFHIPAWIKFSNVKLVAIVDKDISKAKKLANKFKIKFFETTIKKVLIKTDVDAVDICASNHSHEKLILECLRNNLHLICEKPFVHNFKSINKIKKLSIKKQLVCISAQHQRFRSPSIILKKMILKKKVGNIYFINIKSLYNKSHVIKNNDHIKSSLFNGLLLDLGSHFFDLLLWFLNNSKPISVTAFSSKKLSTKLKSQNKISQSFKINDFVCGSIQLKKNIFINFKFNYLLNSLIKKNENLEIFADKGNITWPKLHMKKNFNKKVFDMGKKELIPASYLMIKDFINKINSKKNIEKNFDILENTSQIIDALRKSSKKQRTVYFENI